MRDENFVPNYNKGKGKQIMRNQFKPEGALIASTENHEYTSSLVGLERALDRQKTLEGIAVLCDNNCNLTVNLNGIRGIIPRCEVQFTQNGETIKDIAILSRVGKPVCFKVTGFTKDDSGNIIPILSRRAAQEECVHNFIKNLIPGDIVESKVTHNESFGSFIDIGRGIIALLPIDSISVSRISHPSDRVMPGEKIYTIIKSIDQAGRIFVSHRELLGTWEENASRFSQGQTAAGIVRSVESYGIFIELAPNLAGLAECRPGVVAGQLAAVYIKSIIPERMKIKLAIIDSLDGDVPAREKHYFFNFNEIDHISKWTYSPLGASKTIETVF